MTSRPDFFAQGQVPDMERRLASVIRYGTVAALDYSNPKAPRVRVKAGDVTTGWIPWSAGRAGRARVWSPLKVGEQVILAAPCGDLAQAAVIGSIFFNDREAPANGEDVTSTEWDDGAVQSYSEGSHEYLLDIPAGGKITMRLGGTTLEMRADGCTLTTPLLTVNGNIQLNGEMNATGDVVAGGISLITHLHDGVMGGPSFTGEPV